MSRTIATLALAAFLAVPSLAWAGCSSNGQLVADGTRIGPNVCVNGQWVYSP